MNIFTGDLYSMYVVLQGIGSLPCQGKYHIRNSLWASSNPGCLKFLNYTDLKVDGSTQKPKCPQDGTARWERKRRYFSWNIKRVPPIPKTRGKTTRKDIRVIPRQEAKPPGKTSELSQDRRQNHQERQQSYPKTGGKTTRKDIRVIPRQEAKPPGKTSELSQDRRQNH